MGVPQERFKGLSRVLPACPGSCRCIPLWLSTALCGGPQPITVHVYP